jgi:signal transduction histidine kinase/CheY-like chemotaxis protein
MPDSFISKYALSGLLEIDGGIYAVADKNFKIVWGSKSFKELLHKDRIKGRTITGLFNEDIQRKDLEKISSEKKFRAHIHSLSANLTISIVKPKKKIEGYLLKLDVSGGVKIIPESSAKQYERNVILQRELQDILSLMVKEKSLTVLSKKILAKASDATKSFFGLILFPEEKKKYSFLWYDPLDSFSGRNELEKEIYSSFSFLTKWLSMNKRSLLALNHPNNIGYNLARAFSCESLIISPCILDDNLSAVLIVGRKDEVYPGFEITALEQFSAVLSFAISSIKTSELNTALENRLLQAQKLETIGKLSSGMAHDFNNLLSSIFGSVNLLKKKMPQNEDLIRLLDNIENCSIRAKDLTKGLLSFGKPTPKRKELIKPNLLINEMLKVMHQTFPHNITINSSIDDELYDISGNGTEIYQVLLNLCVNAKEAINNKGIISLFAKNISVSDKNISSYPLLAKGKYINVSVNDNGSGISEENLNKIFEPYFSTKEKESGSGSGLGLYVTYGIIKAHQGHIEVSSQPGKGTTFDVFLPAYLPAETKETAEPSEKIIMLADDEVMLRDLLAELLESAGYNVIRVNTGIEALKVLTEELKVDLVILDYNMPEMNGLECSEKIRSLNFTMPVILSSGSMSLNEKYDLDKAGITSVLTKPYEFDTMLQTIQKLI